MTDANTFIKLSELLVNKLSSIVGANDSYDLVKPYLQLLDDFDDDLGSFILGS